MKKAGRRLYSMSRFVSSKNQENDSQMTPLMKAIKSIHSVSSSGDSLLLEDIKKQRAGQDVYARISTPVVGVDTSEFSVRGIPCEWITPSYKHDADRIILYCHGGGYTCGSLKYARIVGSRLSLHTGFRVVSFEYALAPEHPYPAALEDATVIWNYLMSLGIGAKNVVVVGDSAGGNLALELLLRIKNQGRILPKGLVLMSPWTDMTLSGETYETCKDADPMLTKEYIKHARYSYVGLNDKYNEEIDNYKIEDTDFNYADPKYSPLFGDLDGFPPTLIQVGSNEILKDDSRRLYDKLLSEGVMATLEEYEDAWHVFQMTPGKKTNLAMDSIEKFLDILY